MDLRGVTSVTIRYNDGTKESIDFQQESLAQHLTQHKSELIKGKTIIWDYHEIRWNTRKQEVKGA